jgi:hypothetical protein
MLRAGVMIDADQAALQDGEDAFGAVRGHVFANVFASSVVHRVVDKADARWLNPGPLEPPRP